MLCTSGERGVGGVSAYRRREGERERERGRSRERESESEREVEHRLVKVLIE